MIEYTFDELKSAQAASYLLKLHGRGTKHLQLVKWLHFADRQSISDTGYPITGDRQVSMAHGIVLSNILNLIQDPARSEDWRRYISKDSYGNVQRISNDDFSKLSRFEQHLLEEIHQRYGSMSGSRLSEISHDLPEYDEEVGNSSRPVELSRLFEALDVNDEMQQEIADNLTVEELLKARYG